MERTSQVARLFSRKRLAVSAAILLTLLALYALLGFYAAPPLIHRAITSFAAGQLERKATLGEVRVNPFLLTLELKDFALAERDGARILGFKRLFVDFSASSLARWTWTFSEVALEAPDATADIGPDGTLNLAALIEKLPKGRPDEKLPRLLLQRFAVSSGAVTLSDRSGATPALTVMSPIALTLNELSTLPNERGTYSIGARLTDGGAFEWRGEVSLEPLSSQGEIRFTGLKPLTAWRFLRDELAVEEPRGEFGFGARYRLAFANAAPQLALEDIRLDGRGIVVTAAGTKEPLLSLSSIAGTGGRFDLATRELTLPALEVRDGALVVDVDRQGALNWAKLVKLDAAGAAPRPPGSDAKPWKARVEALRVSGLGLRYTDHSRKQPLAVVAKDVGVELAASATIEPGGTHALLEGIAVTLSGLAAGAPGKDPLAAFDTVTLAGGKVDVGERRIGAERVAIKGGLIRMARDQTGNVGAMSFLAGDDAGALRREVADVAQRAKAEGRPWSLAVDAFDASGVRVSVSDSSFGEPIALDAEVLKARLAGFHSDGKNPVKVDANVRVVQGGTLTASGTLRTSGEELAGTIKVDGFDLKPLRPAVLRHMRAELASAVLSADMKVEYRLRKGRRELRTSGQARIDNVRINETKGGEQLVGWKSLTAHGMRLTLAPDDLKVDEVRIAGLGAKVVIFKDRSVNLVQAVSLDTGAGPAPARPQPGAQAATVADVEPFFPVTVGRVAFDGGVVDFADLSLVLPFAARIHELTGTVQGISTDRDARALVRLEGRVEEYGLARAEGSLRPFKPTSFMDLTVVFRNVDMPPLSAYSATFAGRRIASGRLALDLHYKINNGVLAGENRVVLEKFTLGERVESPGALNLPLDLAVALLTDSEGRIDLAVPVSGNVDDPKFSYGQVIWQAVGNLLSRIVTAPFRAVAALFGGGSAEKDMENIAFDAGRATLAPPEREKLARLAEGLGKRPQLRVVAEGQYGPADRAALRSRDVEAAIATKLGRTAAGGGVSDGVNVTDAKTQRALEALFIERQSGQALEAFAAQTEKSRGKPVDRVNAALALVGRGSADREFYEALLKRLIDTAPVPDAAFTQLAVARAAAVTDHLTAALKVPADRVTARSPTAAGAAQVKLALEVAAPAAR